ncbi:MAG: hypothetical protein CMJ45_08985 [Planctomyces sp.]|jgi:hypothetical protein|nr:hypothetical protein [Planctomyces sp.]
MGDKARGSRIHIEEVGLVTAEIYVDRGVFRVYLAGDRLSIYLGSYESLDECRDDIESLKRLAQSTRFEQTVSAAIAALSA